MICRMCWWSRPSMCPRRRSRNSSPGRRRAHSRFRSAVRASARRRICRARCLPRAPDLQVTHVPFRGAAQTIPAMLSGDVTYAIDNLASYISIIESGKMRALAVTSAERWPTLAGCADHGGGRRARFRRHVVGRACRAGRHAAQSSSPGSPTAMREIAADPAMQTPLSDRRRAHHVEHAGTGGGQGRAGTPDVARGDQDFRREGAVNVESRDGRKVAGRDKSGNPQPHAAGVARYSFRGEPNRAQHRNQFLAVRAPRTGLARGWQRALMFGPEGKHQGQDWSLSS